MIFFLMDYPHGVELTSCFATWKLEKFPSSVAYRTDTAVEQSFLSSVYLFCMVFRSFFFPFRISFCSTFQRNSHQTFVERFPVLDAFACIYLIKFSQLPYEIGFLPSLQTRCSKVKY